MLTTLHLVLPILIPSWRFFKSIEPSPRVQWTVLPDSQTAVLEWREFRPRPSQIALPEMIVRLFWNPARNEELFVVSCAERIQQAPTPHSINEICRRIRFDASQVGTTTPSQRLQFRLVFVHREDEVLVEEVVFLSDPFPAGNADTC